MSFGNQISEKFAHDTKKNTASHYQSIPTANTYENIIVLYHGLEFSYQYHQLRNESFNILGYFLPCDQPRGGDNPSDPS